MTSSHDLVLTTVPGGNALSGFRAAALLARLQVVVPAQAEPQRDERPGRLGHDDGVPRDVEPPEGTDHGERHEGDRDEHVESVSNPRRGRCRHRAVRPARRSG